MKTIRARSLAGRWVLLCLLVGGTASAGGDHDEVDALLRQGVDLRLENRDEEACAVFARALALRRTPKVFAQLALSEQALGRWLDADRDLSAAVTPPLDPWIAHNTEALGEARRIIDAHLAWLTVDVDAAPAEAVLDGAPLDLSKELRVVVGAHTVDVSAPDRVSESRHVVLAASERTTLRFALAPRAVAVPPPSPLPVPALVPVLVPEARISPPGPVAPPSRTVLPPVLLASGGVVGLGLGTFFGLRAIHEKSERDAACQTGCTASATDAWSKAHSAGTAADISFASGSGLLVLAAVWWVIDHRAPSSATNGALRVHPLAGATRGVGLDVDF